MTDPRTMDVARAAVADRDVVARTLALAFQDDPVFRWVVPDETRRPATLSGVFGVFADAFLPLGHSTMTADGAVLVAPPDVDPFAEAGEEHLARLVDASGEAAERAGLLTAVLDEHHPAAPCAHLQFVGVVPDRQGRGVGSRLLVDLAACWDERGDAAYLEATSPDNRRLYERHGFQVTDEIVVPDGPTLWAMWRDPQALG